MPLGFWAVYGMVAIGAIVFADRILDAAAPPAHGFLRLAAFRIVLFVALAAPAALSWLSRRLEQPTGIAPAQGVPRWLLPRSALIALSFAAIVGGLITFGFGKAAVARTVSRHLQAITELKVHVIENWVDATAGHIAFAVATPHFVAALSRWAASGMQGAGDRADLLESMSWMRTTGEYLEVSLRDARNGALLLSTGSESDSEAVREQAVAAARLGQHRFEDFHAEPERGALVYVGFFVPVTETGGANPHFVMHVAIDPAKTLFPLLQQWAGAEPSAELLLMRRDGDDLVMLNELRIRPRTDLLMRVPISTAGFFAAPLARGAQGFLEGMDDERNPVLAYDLAITGMPWFMVAKVDRAEAFAELVTFSLLTAAMVGGLLLMGAWWWVEQHRHAVAGLRLQVERDMLSRRIDFLARFANDCIARCDADGRILEVNDRCLSTYGYTLDEMLAMNVAALRSPGARREIAETLDKLAQQGSLVYETEHCRKDGSVFPAEISARVIEIDGQRSLQAIIRDISERKRLEAERAEHARHLGELSRRVVSVQEEERRRLSRDLHDRTGANLASVSMNLSAVGETLPANAAAGHALLKDARALLADTIVNIREFCADLRPAVLDYAGLLPALENLAREFGRRTGAVIRFEYEGFSERCSPDLESMLYRIAQEALTNCAKHARASVITLRLESADGRCRMQITDDGCGFDPDSIGESSGHIGHGLLNMRERAEFAGARFRLTSQPGRGTTIEVQFSCSPAAEATAPAQGAQDDGACNNGAQTFACAEQDVKHPRQPPGPASA